MRSKFDEQLSLLHKELTAMGALCENSIENAAAALLDGDMVLAESVIAQDVTIDRTERNVEALCLKLLLQQQPVAHDLRQISSALKMITDMERIGDQAADIAEIITMDNIKATTDTVNIVDMAHATINMVTVSVEAFVKQDAALARKVIAEDDIVDELFDRAKRSLIELIFREPSEGEHAIDLLMIAKYFERIGDHAVNIAEWVIFSITGEHQGEGSL